MNVAKMDMKGTINPNFNLVEFSGIRMHANVQRLQGKKP